MSAEKLSLTVVASEELGSKSLLNARRKRSDYDDDQGSEPELDISPNDVAVAIREAVEGMLQDTQELPFLEASRRAETYLSKLKIQSSVSVEHDIDERDTPDHRGEHTTIAERVFFSGILEVVISTEDEAALWALGLDQGEWDSALKEAVDNLGMTLKEVKVSDALSASLSKLCDQNQARFVAWQSAMENVSDMINKTGDVLEPEQQVREVEAILKEAKFSVEPKMVGELVEAIKEQRDTPIDVYSPLPYQKSVKPAGIEQSAADEVVNRVKIR